MSSIRELHDQQIRERAELPVSNIRLCAVCKTPVFADQIQNPDLRAAMQKDPRNKVYCAKDSGTGKPNVEIGGDYVKPWAK